MSTPVSHVKNFEPRQNLLSFPAPSALLIIILNAYASMSVLVNRVRTTRVVISPLLAQTTLSAAFVSSGLGCAVPGPSSVTIAVDCGPIESLSIHLPCALSFDRQTSVSLGVDWITSVRKWYLNHGCELPGGAFNLRDLLYPTPIAVASTAASTTPVFNGASWPAPNPLTPPPPAGAFLLRPRPVGASPAFALGGKRSDLSLRVLLQFGCVVHF
ncbi:hypothetical protein B0H17DRAFT_1338736 [Mycena rosella]|uniref:Uncharacterized protein n=1 Tax=Mycena rosella TaxID=1033263 RepID=A0AAD7CHT8_MYCRO|nr:hypothetical protein B0H17DRAFT_1338736 [Mycena rosella]